MCCMCVPYILYGLTKWSYGGYVVQLLLKNGADVNIRRQLRFFTVGLCVLCVCCVCVCVCECVNVNSSHTVYMNSWLCKSVHCIVS